MNPFDTRDLAIHALPEFLADDLMCGGCTNPSCKGISTSHPGTETATDGDLDLLREQLRAATS